MKSEWQTEATRREDLRTIEKSISSIDTERALLESHFAQSSDVVPFLDMIDNLAKSAGAKSEVVFLSITKDGTGLLVSANATGSFSSVYKFLTLLENSPYEVDFNSMDLVKETITDQAGKATTGWSMTLEIKLLSFTK